MSPLMLIAVLVEENVYAPLLLLAPIITAASENDASTPIVFDTCGIELYVGEGVVPVYVTVNPTRTWS
jgi:hypothetical protein